MKKEILSFVFFFSCFVSSSYAITNGGPDDGEHPYVGLAVMHDASGTPLWRCSGTLIAPQLFLTAGHCTQAPAVMATIWFDEDVQSGIPDNGYPKYGEGDVNGVTHVHPQYNHVAFYLYDLGMIVLDEEVVSESYGKLPQLNQLDSLFNRRGVQDTSFTAVGYGLQKINPVFEEEERIRLKATLQLVDIRGTVGVPNDTSIMLTANAHTGGTCFGDSGGPLFADGTTTVVAVTSFGINGNCVGIGGGYRVDKQDDLNWIYDTFGDYLVGN